MAPLAVPGVVDFRLVLCRAKVAVTLLATDIVTLQAPVPLHAPLQPVKVENAAGVGVRVTTVPLLYVDRKSVVVGKEGECRRVPLPVQDIDVVELNECTV